MARQAALPALLLLAGCTMPIGQPREAAPRDPAEAACTAQAERMILRQDRGQAMRFDEAENRRDGNITATTPTRAEAERMGQQMARDRLIAECLRGVPR